jgi:hypothetical protein
LFRIPDSGQTTIDMREVCNIIITWILDRKMGQPVFILEFENIVLGGDDLLCPSIKAWTILNLETESSQLIYR